MSRRTAAGWTNEEIREDSFSPKPGQAEFVLSDQPLRLEEVDFFVNGVRYPKWFAVDVLPDRCVARWLSAAFELAPTDDVVVRYPRSRP